VKLPGLGPSQRPPPLRLKGQAALFSELPGNDAGAIGPVHGFSGRGSPLCGPHGPAPWSFGFAGLPIPLAERMINYTSVFSLSMTARTSLSGTSRNFLPSSLTSLAPYIE